MQKHSHKNLNNIIVITSSYSPENANIKKIEKNFSSQHKIERTHSMQERQMQR